MPLLHIKLGFMKQLVKALEQDGPCFGNVGRRIFGLSTKKLEVRNFKVSEIRQLRSDPGFVYFMSESNQSP